MTVPYTFATATSPIPLSQLDANFAAVSSFTSTYQTATQGQTVFTSISYTVGNGGLLVFVNGSKQVNTLNYNETSSTSITFVDGLNVGDIVEFVVL